MGMFLMIEQAVVGKPTMKEYQRSLRAMHDEREI